MTQRKSYETAFNTECTETRRARRKTQSQTQGKSSFFFLSSSLCTPCLRVLRVERAFKDV